MNHNNSNNPPSWDAQAYNEVSSNVQLEWGRKLIEKRRWIGNEIVMDAGSGSGNLTQILADKVPYGMDTFTQLTLTLIWCNRQSLICRAMQMWKSFTQAWIM